MTRLGPLACFWFLWFGSLGVMFPFYGLYLRENAALSGTELGAVLATLPLGGMLFQPLWGQLADRTGLRTRILALLTFGACLGYLALGRAQGFAAIFLATLGLAAFSSSVLPASLAVTLALVRDAGLSAFGRIRVWGTLGFLALVATFPRLLHALQARSGLTRSSAGPSEPGLEIMFLVTASLALGAAGVALLLPKGAALELRAERGDWRRLLCHGPFVRGLSVSFGAQLALHGPMAIFPIFVRARGGDLDTVSHMWMAMLAVEVPLVLGSGWALARLGARGLLAVGIAAGSLRWLVCGTTSDMPTIFAAQLLHGVIVTGVLVGAPHYIEACVPEELRSTGQAWLGVATVSSAGLSSLGAGWLLERLGTEAPYITGGLLALVLLATLRWLLPHPRRPDADIMARLRDSSS